MTNTGAVNSYRDLYITQITMESKPTMSWTKNEQQLSFDKGDLVAFDYVEPTLEVACLPQGTNVYVTVDNVIDNCVKVKSQSWDYNGNLSWELYLLDKGNATVTAHAVTDYGNGQEILTASYFIVVDVDEYTWEMDENDPYKYILTGAGAILDPYMKAVPYITMTYGDPDEVGVVVERNDHFVANIIDPDGNRAVILDNNKLPIHGTFYKFEPQIDGKFNLWLNMYNDGCAVLIDATDPTHPVDNMPSGFFEEGYNDIAVQGGHTYYLFGITPDIASNYPAAYYGDWQYYNPNGYNKWTIAELSAFRFEPKGELIYHHKGVVYKDGKFYDIDGTTVLYDTPKQPLGGHVEYVLEYYPDDSNKGTTKIKPDGTLEVDENFHGAIAVKATIKSAPGPNGTVLNRDYYIVTVPYKTHDWWFTESVNPKELVEDRPAAQKQDFTTWGVTYKVLRPEYKTVTINGQSQTLRLRKEVKDPVLCSSKFIHGNNAGYVIQTAGLLFDAQAKRFGVNTDMSYVGLKQTDENGNVITVNDANGIPIDQYLTDWNIDEEALERDEQISDYAYFKTTADTYGYPTNLVTMATESSLIIPDLEEGQHIRIYWKRHNKFKGDKYTATGVTDLEGTDITGNFWIGNGNDYTEFIAKGGNATFTLNDNDANTSWTDIYRITVGEVGEFLDTRLNVRGASIIYNPRNAIPLVVTNPQGETEYIDYHGQNLAEDYPGYTDKGHWGPIAQYNEPYMIVTNDNNNETEITFNTMGGVGGNNMSTTFNIAGNVGTPLTMNGNKIKFKGNGYVAVVGNQKSGDYVINTDTVTIAYGTVDFQTYPHTWDFSKIGVNTTTPAVLNSAYTNGTGINWYKKNQWGDPNTKDEKNFKLWQPATDVEGEWILNGYQKSIKASMFAQGSQLSDGFNALEETKGLGIFLRKGKSGSYFGYTMTKDTEDYGPYDESIGLDMLRYGTINGQGYLKFPKARAGHSYIIRVPAVSKSNGERVYICADGTPTAYQEQYANGGNGSAADITELAANEDGNNRYFVPAEDGDVYIDVTDMKVFKIGVTSTFKNLKSYGSKSYATESRHHNERYDLSGYFTGDEVLAYKATAFAEAEGREMIVDDDNTDGVRTLSAGKLTLEPVDVADANTGVILIGQAKAENGHFNELPLFVKDVNTDLTSNSGNLLKPVFVNGNGDSNWGTGTNYILTRSYTTPQGKSVTGPLAFYKASNITPSMDKYQNLAYLDLTGLISENGGNQTVTKTYALAAGDAFSSGETVTVCDGTATITYGKTGGNQFTAAVADDHLSDFPAYTEGNGTNGNKEYGTFYTIVPQNDGTIEVAVVLNADKNFYVSEDGETLVDYCGITKPEKYYGTFTFDVKAGKSYMIWCNGSKLGFYGFNYSYQQAAGSTSGANYDMFWFIDEEEELDGIENISLEEILAGGLIETENAVYYNLNGQKLNGKPSQKGIYICNGKKIYVK
ncbi:MAG: hypothetical protein J5529_05140 [Prevotella sp.]|nr:hypothetical protein [Prevotella sp.]